jgi:poly-beta-1,6-N-acetyl-D-glucosamine synthase
MNTSLLAFVVYWGIWIVVPFLIDGLSALILFAGVSWARLAGRFRPYSGRLEFYPTLSVIIPVLNGEDSLGACLESIRAQTYPPQRMEVVVVDNGSSDNTFAVFNSVQQKEFGGQLQWVRTQYRGKPWALNAGIHLTSGQYLINIDADVVLAPDALSQMVAAFESDPSLSAATGSIEVLPAPEAAGGLATLIAECEFQEYLSAFWMGRQYQSLTNSVFTLAGGFSAFRREALLGTFLYDKDTVSEDTKLTLDIYQRIHNAKIQCIAQAVAYVSPTPSLKALYAQRVRWQRGLLEVAALHPAQFSPNILKVRGVALSRLLTIDHTLIFPRLIWTFLFPAMTAFDYPMGLVASASLFMYVFYIAIAVIMTLSIYVVAAARERARLRDYWWLSLIMPAYRFLIFVFRLAGSLTVLAEPAEWRAPDPVSATQQAGRDLVSQLGHAWLGFRGRLKRVPAD